MRVKVESVETGMGPNQVVVAVRTRDGCEYISVSRRSLDGDGLEIGYPVGCAGGYYCVEFPCETDSGAWRAWVPMASVTG